ncbi:hypothetical protein GCM10009601_47460 [Streptomyces thermospinosisporus]|uniref:MFS transporter n=1 Tax=Streptomyces thermospinosisporus TaxID=161482 RepID=A0ABN1Z4A9_9ACTN
MAAELPGRAGDALATAAREAFTSGMQGAAIAGAVVLTAAAALAARSLRGVRDQRDQKETDDVRIAA